MHSPESRSSQLFFDCLLDFWSCIALATRCGRTTTALSPDRFLLSIQGWEGKSSYEDLCELAATAHYMDFDDVHGPSRSHASALLIPAILAERGEDDSLDSCAAAFQAGLSAMTWLSNYLGGHDLATALHPSAVVGPLGVAVTLCTLAGDMSANQREAASSMALDSAIGYRTQFGFDVKQFHIGDACARGWLAWKRARAGFTAANTHRVAEAMSSLMSTTHTTTGNARHVTHSSPADSESFWRKRIPVCSAALSVADAGAALGSRVGGHIGEIRSITLTFPSGGDDALIFTRPQDWEQGRFSAEYVFASELLGLTLFPQGRPDLEAEVAQLISITRREYDARLRDIYTQGGRPVDAEITLGDGTRESVAIEHPSGSPMNPMTRAELVARFRESTEGLGWPAIEEIMSGK